MKRQRPVRILQAVFLIFLVLLVISNIYLMIMQLMFQKELPKIFGYAQAVVVSGSMQPAIEVGDLLILKEKKVYQVGDIITFKSNQSLVTHRIIAIEGDKAVTKGDSNNVADEPIMLAQIEGKVVLNISGIGNIILFLKTPLGILLMIVGAIIVTEVPLFDRPRGLKDSS